MSRQIETNFTFEQVESVLQKYLLPRVNKHRIMAFYGPLGAGKTTLIKALLRACGVFEVITSPTFAYVKTYCVADGTTIYHFDLYRLENLQQFFEQGFDEYLIQEKSFAVIEWPEIIEGLLIQNEIKKKVSKVYLQYCEDDELKRHLLICDGN